MTPGGRFSRRAARNGDNPYKFTSREWEDEIGLQFNRARFYDPDIGRFISPDPLTGGPDDPTISYFSGGVLPVPPVHRGETDIEPGTEYGPVWGHMLDGKDPAYTWLRPELADRMTETSYGFNIRFQKNMGCESEQRVNYEYIRSYVEYFMRAETNELKV